MARCHLRHPVTDAAGNAVQNALVVVYQADGSTPVTDMFAAATGGSATTSMTSNNQGELEAWFTAPQTVVLSVTDNIDSAFYPAAPSSLLTFTTFTETVEVFTPPAETAATLATHESRLDAIEAGGPLATDVEVANAVSLEAAARVAATQTVRPGPRAVVLSDSLGLGDSSQHGVDATDQNIHGLRSWFTWTCLYSGGAIHLYDNLGVNGYQSGQLLNNAMGAAEPRTPVEVACESDADTVFLMSNTNDVEFPISTTDTNFDLILEALRDAGKFVVFVGLFPRPSTNHPIDGAIRRDWQHRWAARNRVPYVDPYDVLVDRATGEYIEAYTRDGIHPSNQGAKVIGRAVWEAVAGYMPPGSVPLASYQLADNTHPTNLLTNALFLDDGTSGRPQDWTAGIPGGVTHTLSEDDRWLGRVWRVVGNPSATTVTLSQTVSTGWSVGDVVAVGFRFAIDITEYSDVGDSGLARVEFIGGSAPTRHELAGIGGNERAASGNITAGLDYFDIPEPLDFWLVTDPITAGTTALKVMVNLPGGIYDFKWGQPTLLNLTTLGIA